MVKWSISTINALRRCNRQYYFAHIAAHYGRKDTLRREAFELKRMQNLRMWPGSVVDKFIEEHIIPNIDSLEVKDFEELANKAVQLAQAQFDFSERRLYEDPNIKTKDVGSKFAILSIHKLQQEFTENDLYDVYGKIRRSILNFPKIRIPKYEVSLLEFIKGSSWRLPNVMNWSFNVDDIRVSPQIDMIMFYEDKPVIIDWKVSESLISDYSRQLIVCGLTVLNWQKKKARERGGEMPKMEDYTLMEVNLLGNDDNVKMHELNFDRASEIVDYINLSGSDLRLLLNGRKYSEIDINEFDFTDKDTTCRMCNFQQLCERIILNTFYHEEKAHN